MKLETRTKFKSLGKSFLWIMLALLVLGSIFTSITSSKIIELREEKEGKKETICILEDNLQVKTGQLGQLKNFQEETTKLFSELQYAQQFIDDTYATTKMIDDTMSLRLERNKLNSDWNRITQKFLKLDIKDSINQELKFEFLNLLEERYTSVWNNKVLVINSGSTLVNELEQKNAKKDNQIHELRRDLIRAESKSKPDTPKCDYQALQDKIRQLENQHATDQLVQDLKVQLAEVNTQILGLDNTISILTQQQKIPTVNCLKRPKELLKKIRTCENHKLNLQVKYDQIERELSRKDIVAKHTKS